jgi:hypothetical protein
MSPENFAYWLQGYFEISNTDQGMNEDQVRVIKEHLQLVLNNVTNDGTIGNAKIAGNSINMSDIYPSGGVHFKGPCSGKLC